MGSIWMVYVKRVDQANLYHSADDEEKLERSKEPGIISELRQPITPLELPASSMEALGYPSDLFVYSFAWRSS